MARRAASAARGMEAERPIGPDARLATMTSERPAPARGIIQWGWTLTLHVQTEHFTNSIVCSTIFTMLQWYLGRHLPKYISKISMLQSHPPPRFWSRPLSHYLPAKRRKCSAVACRRDLHLERRPGHFRHLGFHMHCSQKHVFVRDQRCCEVSIGGMVSCSSEVVVEGDGEATFSQSQWQATQHISG